MKDKKIDLEELYKRKQELTNEVTNLINELNRIRETIVQLNNEQQNRILRIKTLEGAIKELSNILGDYTPDETKERNKNENKNDKK